MNLDINEISELLKAHGGLDSISNFRRVIKHLDSERIEFLINSFLNKDIWLIDKIAIEREDKNWLPFLKGVLSKPSEHLRDLVTVAITNITENIICNYSNSNQDDKLFQILDLASYLRWGIDDYILIYGIIDNPVFSSKYNLRESSGTVLARYKLTPERQEFWLKANYRDSPFLIYPYLLAFQNEKYILTLEKLFNAENKPEIHNNFECIILDILDKIELGFEQNELGRSELLLLIIELPFWLRDLFERLSYEYDIPFFNVEVSNKSLNQASYSILNDFEKSFYNEFKFTDVKPNTYEYYFLLYPIYDLSILEYIKDQNIDKLFGLKLNGFEFSWKNYKIRKGELIKNIKENREIESFNFFDENFQKINRDNINIDGQDTNFINRGNLLVVIPRQLVPKTKREEGIDIAICNLFNHSFIINRTKDQLFEETEQFRLSNLPMPGANFENNFINQIFALVKKGYRYAGYDKRANSALEALFDYLNTEYDDFFDKKYIVPPYVNKEGEATYTQEGLIQLLNHPVDAPNVLIIAPAPVLAYAVSQGNSTYLFNLDDIKTELITKQDKNHIQLINNAFIHTSLHINVSQSEYRFLDEDKKSDIHRLYSMIMFTINRIKIDTQSYIKFISESSRLNPMHEDNSKIDEQSIRFAFNKSYTYVNPDLYDSYFYSENSDFIPHFQDPDKTIEDAFSKHIYIEYKKIFTSILDNLEKHKDEILASMIGTDIANYVETIHNKLIKLLTKDRYLIDVFGSKEKIINKSKDFLTEELNNATRLSSQKRNDINFKK